MPSRREFFSTVATALAASSTTSACADWLQSEVTIALNGPVGLQMWSLREYLPKDLPGTLAKVKIDMPKVLNAARKAGTALYYVEDESATPLASIPKSLAWLRAFRFPPR